MKNEKEMENLYRLETLMYDIRSCAYGRGVSQYKIAHVKNSNAEKEINKILEEEDEKKIHEFKEILTELILS